MSELERSRRSWDAATAAEAAGVISDPLHIYTEHVLGTPTWSDGGEYRQGFADGLSVAEDTGYQGRHRAPDQPS